MGHPEALNLYESIAVMADITVILHYSPTTVPLQYRGPLLYRTNTGGHTITLQLGLNKTVQIYTTASGITGVYSVADLIKLYSYCIVQFLLFYWIIKYT